MIKKIYIDSDSILYRSAHINNHKDDCADEALAIAVDGSDENYLDSLDALDDAEATDIMEAMQSTFHSMVDAIVSEVQIDAQAKGYEVDPTPILVLTVKDSSIKCENLAPNFRYEVMESVEDENVKAYKHSRKGMEVPDGLGDLYDYVFDLPNCICIGGVEADDVGLGVLAGVDEDPGVGRAVGDLTVDVGFGLGFFGGLVDGDAGVEFCDELCHWRASSKAEWTDREYVRRLCMDRTVARTRGRGGLRAGRRRGARSPPRWPSGSRTAGRAPGWGYRRRRARRAPSSRPFPGRPRRSPGAARRWSARAGRRAGGPCCTPRRR